MGQMLGRFLKHVMPGVVKPLRVLWNEIIGFVFLVLALLFAAPAVRAFFSEGHDAGSWMRVIGSGLFALVLAAFGVHSFLRARKISRT